MAKLAFQSMTQAMFAGWDRQQLLGFISATRQTLAGSRSNITLYRGNLVTKRFGAISQSPPDSLTQAALRHGKASHAMEQDDIIRYVFPLKAAPRCLQCHINARVGDVLGAIDVHQDMAPWIAASRQKFLKTILLLAPLPFLVALLVVLWINRNIGQALTSLHRRVGSISRVDDLRYISTEGDSLGFQELDEVFDQVRLIALRLRTIAVDKDVLEFEIGLLEKFIITSEVVKDWHEYVKELLRGINKVMEAFALFCIFKIDDELFGLDIFWLNNPSEEQRLHMERKVRMNFHANPYFQNVREITVNNTVADPSQDLPPISTAAMEVQTKSLLVETPKIGGIVGIGVQTDVLSDSTRMLVMDSVLSTLLNVVGSVKAIHKYTKDLDYYATRDPLTGLFNQRMFWELLGYEIGRASRHGQRFALLVLDLDNFKSVNDTYGHHFGDQVLQEFAISIRKALRTEDIVCRYGGDEFVAILPEITEGETYAIASRLVDITAQKPSDTPDGGHAKITASVGIAIYPDHADNDRDLFMLADNMMYKAKQEGKNRVALPDDEDVAEAFRRIGAKSQIVLKAIELGQIRTFFQPIVHTGSGEIFGVEVLSRIPSGQELFEAGEFIELAEKMGIIHKLDYIAIDKALAEVVRSGYEGLVFVNLSPRAIVLNEFLPKVKEIIDRHGIPSHRIVFEITERETIKNITLLTKFVSSLKLDGFRLAVDDFGSGFSSYHYLKHFPIDFIKIEGEFVLNVCRNETDCAFVRSIANLAKELGIQTIAEYVEDDEVMEQVRAAGVDFAQGWHIGRPQPTLDSLL